MLNTLMNTSEGNPGCLMMLMDVIKFHQHAFFDVVDILTENDIRGAQAYMLWNDGCGRDTGKMIKLLYAIRSGSLSMDMVSAHFSEGRCRPFTDDDLRPQA